MIALFGLTFGLLILAALGMAVGRSWGRPLLGGSCRTRLLAGGPLPGCEACPALEVGVAETGRAFAKGHDDAQRG